jgi:hypothetical protein
MLCHNASQLSQTPSISSTQRGGTIRLFSSSSLANTITRALNRVTGLIASKLDDFFDLAEYDWTPKSHHDTPSMYLYELVNWLTTVVDSLIIKEVYKDQAYHGAVGYIAECLMVSYSFVRCCRRSVFFVTRIS